MKRLGRADQSLTPFFSTRYPFQHSHSFQPLVTRKVVVLLLNSLLGTPMIAEELVLIAASATEPCYSFALLHSAPVEFF
jgi:hypothetical protein